MAQRAMAAASVGTASAVATVAVWIRADGQWTVAAVGGRAAAVGTGARVVCGGRRAVMAAGEGRDASRRAEDCNGDALSPGSGRDGGVKSESGRVEVELGRAVRRGYGRAWVFLFANRADPTPRPSLALARCQCCSLAGPEARAATRAATRRQISIPADVRKRNTKATHRTAPAPAPAPSPGLALARSLRVRRQAPRLPPGSSGPSSAAESRRLDDALTLRLARPRSSRLVSSLERTG